MNGWAMFLIIVVVLALVAGGGFFAYLRIYKKNAQHSANYPAPAPSGIVGWVNDKVAALKRGRFQSNSAGYEPSGGGVFGRGGTNTGGGAYGRPRGGALDPDEAWDSRVDNEAYFEEQELGLHAPTAYHGAQSANPYEVPGAPVPDGPRGRELDRRYEEEMHGGASNKRASNPFGDEHAAPSLRGVSPRPLDTSHAGGSHGDNNSPTERKSVFRENMS